jgi:hypothetical protein
VSPTGTTQRRVVTFAAIGVFLLAAIGFVADATDLVSFGTGKDLPDLLAVPAPSQTPEVTVSRTPPIAEEQPTNAASDPGARKEEVVGTSPTPEPDAQVDVAVDGEAEAAVDGETDVAVDGETETDVAGADVVDPTQQSTNDGEVWFTELALSPKEFSAAEPQTVTIDIWDAPPETIIDVEVADVESDTEACSEIQPGWCDVIDTLKGTTDADGHLSLEYEWSTDRHPGIYTVAIRDRASGTVCVDNFTTT